MRNNNHDASGSTFSDWKTEELQPWRSVARQHARLRPCAPASVPESTKQRRATVARELGIEDGRHIVAFVDYADRTITASAAMLCGKLAVDVDHARHAGWVRRTLLDPIEVWDRWDLPGDAEPKRHYFSAYTDGASNPMSYIVVVTYSDRHFVTAFPKAGSLDGKRTGHLVFRAYPKPSRPSAPQI